MQFLFLRKQNKMYKINNFRKFLLNRVTCTQNIIEYIENCLATEDENIKHSFHKIMIHNWSEGGPPLFDILTEYFGVALIPINFCTHLLITTFYTSSLSFILKVIKLDFMFPHRRNMYNIDILFNDKTSLECFQEKITIEDIVSEVISLRFNEFQELNLSNICNDAAFIERKVYFYKLSLLSNFKILMIRMGRDTKLLNLSNNELNHIPLDILNFFIKGDLTGVNLSNNNIPSISELQRVSSKIEKLWIEGNPLCDEMDSNMYIKQILQKFPRLTELDGLKINNHGILMPFYKSYLESSSKKTMTIVEKFVSLYFAHYDTNPRNNIDMFYDPNAHLTLSTSFTKSEQNIMATYATLSRNMMEPKTQMDLKYNRIYQTRHAVVGVLTLLPESVHDPKTFTVDVLRHDNKSLVLVIDGIYKEISSHKEHFLQFRRTFIFNITTVNSMSYYNIAFEMFSVSFANAEKINNSFQTPVRHLNELSLINPEQEDKNIIHRAFTHITQLKRTEAERRLENHNWDLRTALQEFVEDYKNDAVKLDMITKGEISDFSSLLDDDEID